MEIGLLDLLLPIRVSLSLICPRLFAFCSPFLSLPFLSPSPLPSFCLPSLVSRGASCRPAQGVPSRSPLRARRGSGRTPAPSAALPRGACAGRRGPRGGGRPSLRRPGRAHRRPLLPPARGRDRPAADPSGSRERSGRDADLQKPLSSSSSSFSPSARQHGPVRSGGRPRPLPPAAAAAPQWRALPPRRRAAAAAARERVVPQPLPLLPHHRALHASDAGERPRRVAPDHHPVSSRRGLPRRPGAVGGGGRQEGRRRRRRGWIPGVRGTGVGGGGASTLCLRSGEGAGPEAVALPEGPERPCAAPGLRSPPPVPLPARPRGPAVPRALPGSGGAGSSGSERCPRFCGALRGDALLSVRGLCPSLVVPRRISVLSSFRLKAYSDGRRIDRDMGDAFCSILRHVGDVRANRDSDPGLLKTNPEQIPTGICEH